MTIRTLGERLYRSYRKYRLGSLHSGNCKHREVMHELRSIVEKSGGLLTIEEAGSSLEGRSIPLVRCGKGRMRVLLWSQMHGDECTATLALLDMFKFFTSRGSNRRLVDGLFSATALYFIPMLNPDGAERSQRHTAVGIDMNRDARSLLTPEAKCLRRLHRRLRPEFGFNLHDQELSSAGMKPSVAAIALLAPAADEKRTVFPGRARAMRIAGLMSRVLHDYVPGHVTRYDDTFEPRAFGDSMQAWGTSTVLVESGHWPGDPRKEFIRQLNFVGLTAALYGIARGWYKNESMKQYTELPTNGKRLYDIIVRNLTLQDDKSGEFPADIGVVIEPRLNKNRRFRTNPLVTIKEVGDLDGFGALHEVDAGRKRVGAKHVGVEQVLRLRRLSDILRISFHKLARVLDSRAHR